MSMGSLLLRLLLCLCLVLNGTASAAASAGLPMRAAGERGPTHAVATATESMPCHHAATALAGTQIDGEALPAPYGHGKNGHDQHSPDCCKSGACRCACMHAAQIV